MYKQAFQQNSDYSFCSAMDGVMDGALDFRVAANDSQPHLLFKTADVSVPEDGLRRDSTAESSSSSIITPDKNNSLENTSSGNTHSLKKALHHANRLIIAAITLAGLLLDGLVLADVMVMIAAVHWLWLDEFDWAEMNYIHRFKRRADSSGVVSEEINND